MPRTKHVVARKFQLVRLGSHPKIHWPPGVEPNPPWVGIERTFEPPDPAHVQLSQVELVETPRHTPDHLSLTGTYGGNTYRTTLAPDEPALLTNLFLTLKKCLGEIVRDIGQHDVDHNLNLL
jgi:hypothetical protein